jgi:alpha-N-arabinofuranosidase
MTNSNGLLRQTTYFPYSWAIEFARGETLDLFVESPTYEVARLGAAQYVDVAGTIHKELGKLAFFLLNRDLANSREVEIIWEGSSPRAADALVLTGTDLKASNTFETPNRVTPQKGEAPSNSGGRWTLKLPPRSYSVIQWTV